MVSSFDEEDCQPLVQMHVSGAHHRRHSLIAIAAVTVPILCGVLVLSRRSVAVAKSRHQLLTSETVAAYQRLSRILADAPLEAQPAANPSFENLAHVQCSADVLQTLSYLGQTVVWIDRVIIYDGAQCPDNTLRGCVISATSIVASLVGVAGCISLIASSCAATVNVPSACAADVSSIVSQLTQLVGSGTAVVDDCKFVDFSLGTASAHRDINFQRHRTNASALGRRMSGSALQRTVHKWEAYRMLRRRRANDLALVHKLEADQLLRRQRANDLALCSFDVVQAASYMIRIIQIMLDSVIEKCKNPRTCTVYVSTIVSAFFSLGQFLALLGSDCIAGMHSDASCAADILDMIASITNLVASAAVVGLDCGAGPNMSRLSESDKNVLVDTFLQKDI